MDRFIARQPIFDGKRNVHGYEILFRSGPENFFMAGDGDAATLRVISESLDGFGLDRLTAGRKAFINLPRTALLQGVIRILPNTLAVAEILESVEPDDDVLAACRALRASGYRIALDDFERADSSPLIDVADIIKVDMMTTTTAERKRLAGLYRPRGIELLAEKVETHDEFREAVELGYTWFQGYFFCRPEMISRRSIPVLKQNYLRFLHEVNRPDLDHTKLEPIIRQDVSLTVRLLRLLNSAFFGLRTEVTSVRHALMLLGRDNVRQWASLLAMIGLADDKPSELLTSSLVRARCCELLGLAAGVSTPREDLFLLGLLSTIDALTDQPMEKVLEDIPLAPDLKAALLEKDTPLGGILAVVKAGERGDWPVLAELCRKMNIDENEIPEALISSMDWAGSVPRAA